MTPEAKVKAKLYKVLKEWGVYYFSTAFGENIWRKAGGGPAGTVELDAGRAFWLNNQVGNAGPWFRELPYSQ